MSCGWAGAGRERRKGEDAHLACLSWVECSCPCIVNLLGARSRTASAVPRFARPRCPRCAADRAPPTLTGPHTDVRTPYAQPGTPNLDVRLTRSQSGNILDIDFGFGAQGACTTRPLRHLSLAYDRLAIRRYGGRSRRGGAGTRACGPVGHDADAAQHSGGGKWAEAQDPGERCPRPQPPFLPAPRLSLASASTRHAAPLPPS